MPNTNLHWVRPIRHAGRSPVSTSFWLAANKVMDGGGQAPKGLT